METHSQAEQKNELVKHAWRLHPKRIVIRNNRDFAIKINLAIKLVGLILAGENYDVVASAV